MLDEGALDGTRVWTRQPLYKGTNGKVVERFQLQTDTGAESFIFKPLTNIETIGREHWVHNHVLQHLTQIQYPKILQMADHQDPNRFWAIFEDLGSLSHELSEADLVRVASVLPYLHHIPADPIPDTFSGNKPVFEAVVEILKAKWSTVQTIMLALGIAESSTNKLHHLTHHVPWELFEEKVTSHGDLHRGNIAVVGEKVIVLDWEHAHKNSPYWDLFNLIDISHPLLRRETTGPMRKAVLNGYFSSRQSLGWQGVKADFEKAFYSYSAIYSAWLLLLIEDDFKKGSLPKEDLLEAQRETALSLSECLSALSG